MSEPSSNPTLKPLSEDELQRLLAQEGLMPKEEVITSHRNVSKLAIAETFDGIYAIRQKLQVPTDKSGVVMTPSEIEDLERNR